jgi:SEC-C motif-containing protein
MDLPINCYCKSDVPFDRCCQPYILGKKSAPTAESLMRSRFSAYVIGDFEYVLKTYAEKQRSKLSVTELAKHSTDTQWLSLEVLNHAPKQHTAQVEF